MLRKNLGIDIGTGQTSIFSTEEGILLREPSVVAVDFDTDEVVEAGIPAMRLVEANPDRCGCFGLFGILLSSTLTCFPPCCVSSCVALWDALC